MVGCSQFGGISNHDRFKMNYIIFKWKNVSKIKKKNIEKKGQILQNLMGIRGRLPI